MMDKLCILDYWGTKSQLADLIGSAQVRLRNKILELNVKSSGISEYTQRYMGDKLTTVEYKLQIYGRLLFHSLSSSSVLPENFTLVDYGGGSGVMSFLAKEMGIGTVIYNDIYDLSCNDVMILSNIFELPLDHVVCGDIDDLIFYLHGNSIFVDAITSFDVLEHIYDVEYHFKKLFSLSDGKFRVVHASGANNKNPRTVYSCKKKQIEFEYKNRERKWGHKERGTLRAFFDIRKEIISDYAPDLTSKQVEQLSRLTRGLIKSDIENCVDEYRQRGNIKYCPDHPTNTCNPYNGNWAEHLMSTQWLQQIIKDSGFSVEILNGYYPVSGSSVKKGVKLLYNTAIRILGKRGMFLAPYYIVYANRLAGQSIKHNCNIEM